MLHVNLQKADGYAKNCLVRILLDVVEYVLHSPWHYSELILLLTSCGFALVKPCLAPRQLVCLIQIALATKDSVGLARASLPIGHDHPVKPIKHITDDRCCDLSVTLILAGVHLKHGVKAEIPLVKTRPHQ